MAEVAASPARGALTAMQPCGPIRAVLFDFDGVLTTDAYGSLSTFRALAAATGIDARRLASAMAPFMHDLILGRTTHAAIWPAFVARLGAPIDASLLHAAFDATPMNAPMLDLARRVTTRCRVGIVTDNMADRMAHLVARHGLAARFDPIVVSAALGCRKDGPAIFEVALRPLGVPPWQALFIDNTPANLVAPAALGMHVLHHDDAVNDVPGLEALLRERHGIDVPCGTTGVTAPDAESADAA